ncbi:MAG: SDR family oxidoreductase [Chitinophagia bacterium]|nr:SDR family oxidoreductase [Chitinophagia bacterium]
MNNTNTIALVTGGSRGLGKNMAQHLGAQGTDVIITYNNRKDDAEAVVAELQQMGRKAAALQLSTGVVSSFGTFAEQVHSVLNDTFGTNRFDYLVNNAGSALYMPVMDTTEEQFDEIVNVHFKGVFFLTQKLLPMMNDGGGIVNISSGLARVSFVGSSVYGSMKGAVEVLSRYLAKELGSRGIRVNTVAPGAIETDFGGGRVRDNKDMNDMISGLTALGRVGLPDDIGGVVAFLCSPAARWVNAQRIEASGGMLI